MWEDIVTKMRRRPLFDESGDFEPVKLGVPEVERMIPHRDPFRLVDGVSRVNLLEEQAVGYRHIAADDPIFRGHFPAYPVYPGALLVEMIGQMSLCLQHLLHHGRTSVEAGDKTQELRLMKVHHAVFQAEVSPGDDVRVLCKRIAHDSIAVVGAGQVVNQRGLCASAILEVYLSE